MKKRGGGGGHYSFFLVEHGSGRSIPTVTTLEPACLTHEDERTNRTKFSDFSGAGSLISMCVFQHETVCPPLRDTLIPSISCKHGA